MATKKVKRVDFIVNPKGSIVSNLFTNKANRLKRFIDNGIANTEDAIIGLEEDLDNTILSLGSFTSAGDSNELGERINNYLKLKSSIRDYKENIEYLKALRESLDDEIEVTIESK